MPPEDVEELGIVSSSAVVVYADCCASTCDCKLLAKMAGSESSDELGSAFLKNVAGAVVVPA